MTKQTTTKRNAPPHRTYANPTIGEALCELHFALPADVSWKASLAGDLFEQIQNEFPEIEPGMEIGLQFDLSPQRIGHAMLPPRQRMRFKHKERPLLLQLGPNVFTVNVLPVYPGWDQMRADVVEWRHQASQVLKPAKLTRIGLRYINRVEPTSMNGTPGDWFKVSDFVPAGVDETTLQCRNGLNDVALLPMITRGSRIKSECPSRASTTGTRTRWTA